MRKIYGVDGAKEQKTKRSLLQKARGGYGQKKHSEETRALMRITNGGERNGRFGKPASDETRRKIAEKARLRKGANNALSIQYVLTSPEGSRHILHGWQEVIAFCKAHNLSYGTFQNNLQKGWPPSSRGKNVGWIIRALNNENIEPK